MHKIILKGEKSIHVWWVDDCFTSAAQEVTGGSIPYEDLGEWDMNSNVFRSGVTDDELSDDNTCRGDNGQIYVHLKEVASSFGVIFHLCSFEYAEEYWMELNKRNSIILLDISYHEKSDTYGVELWLRMLKAAPLVAKLRFFSGDPIWAEQFCITNGIEPDIPGCLHKMNAIERNGGGRSRFENLLQALIDAQPTELGKLTAAQWRTLRASAWNVAEAYASYNGLGSDGGWVHHLPGGGDRECNYAYTQKGTKAIRDGVKHPVTGVLLEIPDHFWDFEPAWKYPPIRALVQRAAEGKDLSRFFHHLFLDVRKRSLDRVSLDLCYPAGAFKHDYLWFNVVALGEAIIRLAEGFVGEAIKARKQCRAMWSIRELDDEYNPGVEMVLRQFFQLDFSETNQTGAGISDSGNLGGVPCGRFIPEGSSVKSIKEAYEFFGNAGCEVTGIEGEDGCRNWRIFVKASRENGVWMQSGQEEQS